jgi:hypothetical protein
MEDQQFSARTEIIIDSDPGVGGKAIFNEDMGHVPAIRKFYEQYEIDGNIEKYHNQVRSYVHKLVSNKKMTLENAIQQLRNIGIAKRETIRTRLISKDSRKIPYRIDLVFDILVPFMIGSGAAALVFGKQCQPCMQKPELIMHSSFIGLIIVLSCIASQFLKTK